MNGPEPDGGARAIAGLLRAGRFGDALPLLEAWTGRHPQHLAGWVRRAQCLERLGRSAEALACARVAERLDADNPAMRALLDRLTASLPTLVSSPGAAPGGPVAAPVPPGRPAPGTVLERAGATPTGDATPVPATELEEADTAGRAGGGVPATRLDDGVTDPDADGASSARRRQPEGTVPDGNAVPTPHAGSGTAVDAWQDAAGPAGAEWPVGTLVEGRYEVRGGVRGGMGSVAFVFDRELGIPLAVKTPAPGVHASDAGRARFLREAEAWIALGLHPNVCTAFFVRHVGGLPRLFIEYVDGGTLADWLRDRPDAPLETRLDLAIQIAAGIDHAHTFAWEDEEGRRHRGIVHRDLKPANILLGRDGVARVTDFGLVGREQEPSPGELPGEPEEERPGTPPATADATLAEGVSSVGSAWRTVTAGGAVMGTPPYMAPEQWTGAHAAGAAADVYAFGCILYELFCGRRPFELDPVLARAAPAVHRAAWERMHREQPAPHPRDLARDLDHGVAEVLHACLRKEPERRPASFSQLSFRLRDLHRRLLGRPSPRPEPTAGELLADSLTNRGVSYASLGRREQAARAWRSAVEADPGHAGARFNLAQLGWLEDGASDEELARTLEELRSGSETGWREHLLAGRALLRLGRLHDALARLRAAVDLPGHSPEVVRDCAAALVALASDTRDGELAARARELLKLEGGALRADPRMLVAYALAGRLTGDEHAAARLLGEARRVAPELPDDLERAAERLLPAVLMAPRLAGRGARIVALAVAPDGRIGAAGDTAGNVTLFNLRRGEAVRQLRDAAAGRVRCVAITPDGRRCLVAGDHGPVTVWDVESAAVVARLHPHSGVLAALAVSEDGRVVAGAGSAGTVFAWEASTGGRLAAVKTHPGNATCVALSPDGRTAAVGGGDGRAVTVDLEAGAAVAELAAHGGAVTAVALDARGGRLLTAGESGTIRSWSASDGAPGPSLRGHRGTVRALAVRGDGLRALSAAADGTVRLWDLPSGEPLVAASRGEPVAAAAVSDDWGEVLLAVGGEVHRPRLREARGEPPAWALAVPVTAAEAVERGRRFADRMDTVRGLVADQRFDEALSAVESARSVAGYARSREAVAAAARIAALFPREGLRDGWQERVLDAHDGEVVSAAVAPDGGLAATGGRDRRILLWSWPGGGREGVLEAPSVPLVLRFPGDGRRLLSGDLDGAVRLWDLDQAGSVHQLGAHDARINALALDPLGRVAVSAGDDGSARVWDPFTGNRRHLLSGHLGRVLAAAVAPDGSSALTGGDDGSLLLWDLRTGRSLGALEGHEGAVLDLDWSRDGRLALTVGAGAVRLWDVSRRKVLRVLEDGLAEPRRAVLTADGGFALVGEKGGRLALWALRPRTCERVFEGHAAAVTALELSRDGRRALSASADGSARIWHLDWRPQVRLFAEWDESARPFLEVFLAQQVPLAGDGALRPEWTAPDLQRLLRELAHSGFGWLRPDGVRRRLAELAAEWSGAPSRPAAAHAESARLRAATPVARRRRRAWSRRGLLAGAAALVLVAVTVVMAGRQGLRLDPREAKLVRDRSMAVLLVPAQLARPGPCDPARLADYLRDFAAATDRPDDVGRAIHCLQELADPRSVAPVLDMVRPAPAPDRPDLGIGTDVRALRRAVTRSLTGGLPLPELVASTLARIGDVAVPELERALADRDPAVRAAAAHALALNGSEEAIAALLRAASTGGPGTRAAVAGALPVAAVGTSLGLDEAFALAEELAADSEPAVRAAAAGSLRVFAGSRPRRLLERLARDDDPAVREAAAG